MNEKVVEKTRAGIAFFKKALLDVCEGVANGTITVVEANCRVAYCYGSVEVLLTILRYVSEVDYFMELESGNVWLEENPEVKNAIEKLWQKSLFQQE